MIESLKPIIQAQPFFAGFSEAMTDLIVGCAENVRFAKGDYLIVGLGAGAHDAAALRGRNGRRLQGAARRPRAPCHARRRHQQGRLDSRGRRRVAGSPASESSDNPAQ